jgi:hypothetical protein
VLVVGAGRYGKEELQCKMLLDTTSFCEALEDVLDEKKKRMFVAGKDQVGYFSFPTIE